MKEERNLTDVLSQLIPAGRERATAAIRDEKTLKAKKQTNAEARYESPAYAYRPNA